MTRHEKYQSRADAVRAMHRCIACGKADERTRAGYDRCAACNERMACNARERYAELKAAGLCTRCGVKDERTAAGKYLCFDCAVKRAAYRAAKKEAAVWSL